MTDFCFCQDLRSPNPAFPSSKTLKFLDKRAPSSMVNYCPSLNDDGTPFKDHLVPRIALLCFVFVTQIFLIFFVRKHSRNYPDIHPKFIQLTYAILVIGCYSCAHSLFQFSLEMDHQMAASFYAFNFSLLITTPQCNTHQMYPPHPYIHTTQEKQPPFTQIHLFLQAYLPHTYGPHTFAHRTVRSTTPTTTHQN